MEVYIHYTKLPERKRLEDIVEEVNEILDDQGAVCGGQFGRLDLHLEDENVNPKFAQLAVKSYLQRAGFDTNTTLEIGGMEIGIYES